MASKALMDLGGGGHKAAREDAPSVVRAVDPTPARWLGLAGLMLLTLGGTALMFISLGYTMRLSSFWAILFVTAGLLLLLLHATVDSDMQVRRTYGVLGYLWLATGLLLAVIPVKTVVGALFLPWGFLCLALALFFLLAFLRHEEAGVWRENTLRTVGLVGAAVALTGFGGSLIRTGFLLGADGRPPFGVLLCLLGLPYLWAYVSQVGTWRDSGYKAGLAFGYLGLAAMAIAIIRCFEPTFHRWGWLAQRPLPYLVPAGITLISMGFLYACVSATLCSERKFFVLFRRELSSFFYSPIAYIVFVALSALASSLFLLFIKNLSDDAMRLGGLVAEPVIAGFLVQWVPVIFLIFIVPVLTMRLFSEESRTGTIEVLFTSPVNEAVVVLSKFFAVFAIFMMCWIPWSICILFFRVEGGQPFEYRPLFIFYLMLACTGTGFLSMGLFFSSLTRNQIIAAILTFVGMIVLTMVYWAKFTFQGSGVAGIQGGALTTILTHISYLDLWLTSMHDAEITPKYYVFHLSAAVFWLFLTMKVLESRKWR